MREDRKREVARTIGHLEGLKRELLEELNKQFTNTKQMLAAQQTPFPGTTRPVNVLPGSANESPLPRTHPPTAVLKSAASESNRTGGPIKSYSLSHGPDQPPTCSLSYGRETQHIYDEIKQLALMNTAYEGPYGNGGQMLERHIPIHAYAQLKYDILIGVRSEIQQLLQELKTPTTTELQQRPVVPERSSGSTVEDSQSRQYSTTEGIVEEQKRDTSETSSCTSVRIHPMVRTKQIPSSVTDVHRGSTSKSHQPPRPLIRQSRRSVSPADPERMTEDQTAIHATPGTATALTVSTTRVTTTVSTSPISGGSDICNATTTAILPGSVTNLSRARIDSRSSRFISQGTVQDSDPKPSV